MDEVKYLKTIDEIRAFSEPYRMSILKTFYSLGKPSTVKQIADEMGEVPAKVHYHVKKLVKAGILKLDHTEEVNGIIAKFYYPTAKAFQVKAEDDNLEKANTMNMLSEIAVMCSKILDDNKRIFIESLKIKDNKGALSADDIYLTDEEYDEIIRWIKEKFEKNKQKGEAQNEKRYFLFTGIICTEGKDLDKKKKGIIFEKD